MSKKDDLPWMKWFWGDWFKCPEIRALNPETRCAWFEMLGLMWESTERGFLTLNGKPYPMDCLARCLGFAQANLEQSIAEMESFNVFSKRADGAIYNRRMVSDCDLGEKRAIAGKRGGICSSKTRSKSQAKPQAKSKQLLTSDSDSDIDSDYVFKSNKSNIPTIQEISDYCKERNNSVDADKWLSYYESNGWMVGKNKMKDWKAAVRTWEKNNFNKGTNNGSNNGRPKFDFERDIENKYKDM
jgi:hypothetical protein